MEQSSFFENINKFVKPLTKLAIRKRKRIQIHNIKDKKRGIATDTVEIKRIIRTHFKIYALPNQTGKYERNG